LTRLTTRKINVIPFSGMKASNHTLK
jgi:hypothetical protein